MTRTRVSKAKSEASKLYLWASESSAELEIGWHEVTICPDCYVLTVATLLARHRLTVHR